MSEHKKPEGVKTNLESVDAVPVDIDKDDADPRLHVVAQAYAGQDKPPKVAHLSRMERLKGKLSEALVVAKQAGVLIGAKLKHARSVLKEKAHELKDRIAERMHREPEPEHK